MHGETGWMMSVVRYLDKHEIAIPCVHVMKALTTEKLKELRGKTENFLERKTYEEVIVEIRGSGLRIDSEYGQDQ